MLTEVCGMSPALSTLLKLVTIEYRYSIGGVPSASCSMLHTVEYTARYVVLLETQHALCGECYSSAKRWILAMALSFNLNKREKRSMTKITSLNNLSLNIAGTRSPLCQSRTRSAEVAEWLWPWARIPPAGLKRFRRLKWLGE